METARTAPTAHVSASSSTRGQLNHVAFLGSCPTFPQNGGMTIKKRQRKPDWESIKKYVAARMREQRAWLKAKLKTEREQWKLELERRDETSERLARGLQQTLEAPDS